MDGRRCRHAAAGGCRCGVRGSAVASGIHGTARRRRGGRQGSRQAHERSVRPATQGRDRRHRIGARGLAARRARSTRPAGLERALRPGADRPPVGRPFDPRGVRERAGRRLRRARGRHRTVAGKVSRWRSSRGDRWPPGEAGGLAGSRHQPARRQRRRGPVSARGAGGSRPDAAARRAGRGHSPTAGRGRAARPANGRPVAHRNAQPSQHAGGRTRKGGQDRVVGGAGARSGRCPGRHAGAASRVPLGVRLRRSS